MNKFKLVSNYKPAGDQPQAIAELVERIKDGDKFQTLLGVTGSGKTFTDADNHVQAGKLVLLQTENFTGNPFDIVPRTCKACRFFTDYDRHAGKLERSWFCQNLEMLTGKPAVETKNG